MSFEVSTGNLRPRASHFREQQTCKYHNNGMSAMICLQLILLAGRTPCTILVTYGRETLYCTTCGAVGIAGQRFCSNCKADVSRASVADRNFARQVAERRQEAARRTGEIHEQMETLNRILTDTLAVDHRFD